MILRTRYQEIAREISSLSEATPEEWRKAARSVGLLDVASQVGQAALSEVYGLTSLVRRGLVGPEEADAYLAQRYPDRRWSGGKWAISDRELERLSSEVDALSAGDPVRPNAGLGRLQPREPGFGRSAGLGTGIDPQLTIDELPEEYDSQAVQSVLESLRDQVTTSLAALSAGRISFPPNSIPGSAIAPGSLPSNAVDPHASSLMRRCPGPDDAIALDVRRSDQLDRWITGGGPGRIWRATADVPGSVKNPEGVTRYRIRLSEVDFGILSMRLSLDATYGSTPAPTEVRYGVVIARIPNLLGRAPSAVVALAEGTPPVAFASGVSPGVGFSGGNNLWSPKARQTYQTSVFPYATAIGSSSFLDPTADDLAACRGLVVSLVRGAGDEEVYQGMNTLLAPGRYLRNEATLPSSSLPAGLTPHPPAPPTVYQWDGNAVIADYDSLEEETDDLSAFSRISQGVPFRYQDCEALAPTEDSFSLVLQLDMVHEFTPGSGNTWPDPGEWQSHGVRLLQEGARDWNLDVLVL